MRRLPPKAIGLVAAVLMVAGTVIAVVFALLQSHCDGSVQQEGSVLVPHAARCGGYGVAAGMGVGALALGAVLVAVAGFLSGTAFGNSRRHPPSGERAEEQSGA
jgi:hypothetical protein